METTPTPSRRLIEDVPLPGHYECITAQLNLTLQVRSGLAKWIVATRDPSPGRQIELSRQGGQAPWDRIPEQLGSALNAVLASMGYLAQMPEAS